MAGPSTHTAERLANQALDVARSFASRAREHDTPLVAGGLAFYGLVSLPPLAIAVLWVVSLVFGDQRIEQLVEQLADLMPGDAGDDELEQTAQIGAGLGITAVLAALWPATSYGSGLRRALERMAGMEETPLLRGLRGRGLALIALFPAFVFGGLVATLAGPALLSQLGDGQVLGIGAGIVGAYVATTAGLVLIYRVFPPSGVLQWRSVLKLGAVTGAAATIMSLGFAAYMYLGADFTERYATSALAGVVLLALWLYLFNLVLLGGFKLAVDYEERRD